MDKSNKHINKKNKNILISKNKPDFKSRLVNNLKLLMKDLKRVRWSSLKDKNNIKMFLKMIAFIVIISLILFGIAIGFSSLWDAIGVGAND